MRAFSVAPGCQPGKEGAPRRGLIVYFFVSVGAKSSIVNSRRGDAGSWLQGPARKPRLDVDLVICFRNFIRSINRIAHSWTYFYVDPSSVHVQRLRDGACHHAHRPRTPSWASHRCRDGGDSALQCNQYHHCQVRPPVVAVPCQSSRSRSRSRSRALSLQEVSTG